MKEKDTYNKEMLESILPDSLRVTPFSTPDNFFENQQESIRRTSHLESANAGLDFSVPEGYFESFEERIRLKLVEDQLKTQIPNLGFETPESYFSNLENAIKAKIAESNLKAAVHETGFTVPTDFFGLQKSAINCTISTDRLKTEASDTGYAVPEGYFSALTQSIQKKIANTESLHTETKVVRLSFAKRWIQYASTAAVVFLVGIGSYFVLTEEPSLANSTASTTSKINLQQVSDEEIVSYLAQNCDGDELIQLAKFADNESIDPNHIDSKIKDEDIQEYLNYML